MIGVLVVTHCRLGDALLEAADFILGERPEAMAAVSIDLNENADKLRNKIADGIKKLNSDDGILILTDMFGGTPSNLAISIMEPGLIEVIAGVNLPMLIKLASVRMDDDMDNALEKAVESGKRYINIASQVLNGK